MGAKANRLNFTARAISIVVFIGLVSAFCIAHFTASHGSLGPSIYWTVLGLASLILVLIEFRRTSKLQKSITEDELIEQVYIRAQKRRDFVFLLAMLSMSVVGIESILALKVWPWMLVRRWYSDSVLTMLLFIIYLFFINWLMDATLQQRLRTAQLREYDGATNA